MKAKPVEKPPIGLMPKKIFMETRRLEICNAMNRYMEANKEIPVEWLNEYNEITKSKP